MKRIVKFEKDGCAPCKALGEYLTRKEVKHETINILHNLSLVKQYQITSVPTLILFDGDNEITRLTGFNPEQVNNLINA